MKYLHVFDHILSKNNFLSNSKCIGNWQDQANNRLLFKLADAPQDEWNLKKKHVRLELEVQTNFDRTFIKKKDENQKAYKKKLINFICHSVEREVSRITVHG